MAPLRVAPAKGTPTNTVVRRGSTDEEDGNRDDDTRQERGQWARGHDPVKEQGCGMES